MPKTFFFYDLETSGLNPREARIMQFAGIRTDENLKQLGDPYNLLVKLNDDTLPSPEALMITGITPQQTLEDGYSEAEFAKILNQEIFTADTIAIGFNNIRFDDEFVRHLFWRNFIDPYEWSWRDGKSRWDILDVVRMTRALRPEGITWPVDDKGVATNRLELLSKVNNIDHIKSHDALSDVEALIAVTQLIKDRQPQLFSYLFKMRDKNEVKKLINLEVKQPFVYVSGRYEQQFNKATVAFPLTAGKNGNVIVYDLRYDPTPFLNATPKELSKNIFASWKERQADDFIKLPVKELQYNRSPAVAPISVLNYSEGWEKISLTSETIEKNRKKLLSNPDFSEKIRTIFESRDEFKQNTDPESQLYDGFVPNSDKIKIELVRNATGSQLADLHPSFNDERLDSLLLHYKARNYPKYMSEDEVILWEKWRSEHVKSQVPLFVKSLKELSAKTNDDNKIFILQELHLWLENIIPVED